MSAVVTPEFVVVGNVNQGKSSVVAALSENEAIPIDSYPGTTRNSGTYVFRDGETELFRIVDTPGFQRPRQALQWLRQQTDTAAGRPAAVRAFVDRFEGQGEFHDEVELLRPILAGAGILYVIDASSRLEPSNEAEMEILRWTGQPAMALINKIRDRDHAAEWLPTLRQFFHIVRSFDAHRARFDDRLGLLRGFREIRAEWSASIDLAVATMERTWQARNQRAAALLADLMVDALAHVERRPLPNAADDDTALRAQLADAYREAQRRFEQRTRDEIERCYGHPRLTRSDPAIDLLNEDLFAESTWRTFGLSQRQLLTYGAASGAAIGAGVDLAVGGLSVLAGTLIGGSVGAAAGWFGGRGIAQIWPSSNVLANALFPGDTGRFVAMGPVTSARYAWVLLDRALLHLVAVRDRSHARRDELTLGDTAQGVVAGLAKSLRDPIEAAIRTILSAARRGEPMTQPRVAFELALRPVLAQATIGAPSP